MAKTDLTAQRLRELLNYDPNTGLFTRRISSVHLSEVGKKVGCIGGAVRHRNVIINIELQQFGAHRLAWLHFYGVWPKATIDHINGDGTDNRIENLRDVSIAENSRNLRRPSHNTSGVTGVSWRPNRSKWRAFITLKGKQITLGHFETIVDAVAARLAASREHGFHPNHGRARSI